MVYIPCFTCPTLIDLDEHDYDENCTCFDCREEKAFKEQFDPITNELRVSSVQLENSLRALEDFFKETTH